MIDDAVPSPAPPPPRRGESLPDALDPVRLSRYAEPVSTRPETEARLAEVERARQEIAQTIDTLRSAVHKNHAQYLAGRQCWTYEYRIRIEDRLKTCTRQRQHLQDIYGRLNRCLKHLNHVDHEAAFQAKAARPAQGEGGDFYERFYRLAAQLLTPETLALLTQGARKGEDTL